jgi:hypothetical protein
MVMVEAKVGYERIDESDHLSNVRMLHDILQLPEVGLRIKQLQNAYLQR